MNTSATIDKDKLNEFIRQTGSNVTAGFNCVVSVLGDRVGLFKGLSKIGGGTSQQLADSLGLNERWVREWLQHQACVNQIEYEEETQRFSISPEAESVLVDEDSPAYLMGAYHSALSVFPAAEKLEDAFRSGIGMTYDDHGSSCACGMEKMGAYTKKHRLVQEILPLVPGLVDRLTDGIKVADVGCGGALSTVVMAKAFPSSTFVGYDTSEHALALARKNIEEMGVQNVTVANPSAEPLPSDSSLDFVTTFDVVHDTPYPDQMIQDIFGSLATGGQWLCEDIKGLNSFEENLREHPMAAMLYGFSITICMSSGLSTADGAGLGTLGFTEALAEKMMIDSGFADFKNLEVDTPLNNYYLATK